MADLTVHFASRPGANPREAGAAPPLLDALLPHAERLKAGGQSCVRIATRTQLTGERSIHGYVCPARPGGRGEGELDAKLSEAFAMLTRDARWRDVDPEKIAYIDTETTGLAGGSGTYVFLIGIGRVVGGVFVLNQYFMEDYPEEEALIELVSEDLREAEALVSYNGKCFDIPLMETRWRLQRRKPAFPQVHLDLLYPSRKLWRLRFSDCRLATIEREVLRIMRVSDVEGWLIPQLYFDYLEGIRREEMIPVIDHNAQDICSLVALGETLARAVLRPGDPQFGHAVEQWGLARIFESCAMDTETIQALERAVAASRDEKLSFKLSLLLARRLRRTGRFAEAVALWKTLAPRARADQLEPLVELAKHAEHRLRDFAEASRWTRRALEILQSHRELQSYGEPSVVSHQPSAFTHQLEALQHRAGRLDRRQRRN